MAPRPAKTRPVAVPLIVIDVAASAGAGGIVASAPAPASRTPRASRAARRTARIGLLSPLPDRRQSRRAVDYSLWKRFDQFPDAIQPAIWARELKPSLLRMLRTWLSTVRSEMNRRAPICLLVRPSATSRATSASRLASTPAPASAGAAPAGPSALPE